MKKNVLGLLAVVAAVSLSAFTTKSSKTSDLYYWFRQSDHELVGNSSSPDDNPLECYATGNTCVKGYLLDEEPEEEPNIPPSAQQARN